MTRTLNSLGLLSSEPDPVGEWHVHMTNLPPLYRQFDRKKQATILS